MIELNGKPLSLTNFPDNTSQVWKLDERHLVPGSRATIIWRFTHEGEFLQLAQLKELLDHNHVVSSLLLTYLPYGRQDKPVDNLKTFALVTFAKLINSLNFDHVTIRDPHSRIALNLIKNSKAHYPQRTIENVMKECGTDVVCYPDKGALLKYVEAYQFFVPHLHGEKVRDQLTGNITSYEIVENSLARVHNANVLIVDDICDGGATFKILAKDLLAKGAKSVVLFVTHGIFSKGTRTLFESGITRVFTCDGEVTARSGSIQI